MKKFLIALAIISYGSMALAGQSSECKSAFVEATDKDQDVFESSMDVKKDNEELRILVEQDASVSDVCDAAKMLRISLELKDGDLFLAEYEWREAFQICSGSLEEEALEQLQSTKRQIRENTKQLAELNEIIKETCSK